jgi:predicted glycogen debranching enzyme
MTEDVWQTEWLETNGLGGWASGTVSGIHTRRYHGVLVAAVKPPVIRSVLVAKLDETLTIGGQSVDLSANRFPGAIHPAGHHHIQSFERDLFPQWQYAAAGVVLQKTVAAIHGENTTVVQYEALRAPDVFTLYLRPFYACRDYHSLQHAFDGIRRDGSFQDGIFQYRPVEFQPEVYIAVPGSSFHPEFNWYYRFEYAIEEYRGLDFQEDLFTPGVFECRLAAGSIVSVILSTDHPGGKSGRVLVAQETKRRKALVAGINNKARRTLTLAADQFIVARDTNFKTVIAGYPWFTDWGRDTMIALPGLTLTTRRFDDAKKILRAFARSVDQGMLPNRFPDAGEAPEYNTVDATLWFFVAVYQYFLTAGDPSFVLEELLPVLIDIVEWHERGTRYGICVDADGLLRAGEPGVQLTWMDAKVGDWVVTPRIGKPVEINALWTNALMALAELLKAAGKKHDRVLENANRAQSAFESSYWNGEYLYDVINGDSRDESIRPNQIFALSLPFPLLSDEKAKSVLRVVREKLYTPVGLRSLAPDDPRYIGHYGGDQRSRDGAYHQGTVWSWLLGPYVDALRRYGGPSAEREIKTVVENFLPHIWEACRGSVSEIFDGDAPHHPRGCIAQAWGVAEWLRILKPILVPKKKQDRGN